MFTAYCMHYNVCLQYAASIQYTLEYDIWFISVGRLYSDERELGEAVGGSWFTSMLSIM